MKQFHALSPNVRAGLVLLGLCGMAYVGSFHNAFLMDDYPMLIENLESGKSGFLQLDPSAAQQIYFRPVTHLLNLITLSFFGKNPVFYHLTNLIFFYGAALALYSVVKKSLQKPALGLLAAGLLVLHPINGVCVNYKNATADAFLVFAFMMSLRQVLAAAEDKGFQGKIFLSLVWLLLAVFCHEIALAYPLYLAALLWLSGRYSFSKILRLTAPSLVVLLSYFLFRLQFASLKISIIDRVISSDLSLWNHLATFASLKFWYLAKIFSTQGIVLIWNSPPILNQVFFWVTALLIFDLAMLVIFLKFRKTRSGVSLGLAWFVISSTLVFGACFSRPWFGFIIEPFWMILGSIGIFLVIGEFLLWFKENLPPRVWFITLAGLALVLIIQTWRYNFLWGEPMRYCRYWLSVSPTHLFPQFWLAYAYLEKKEYAQAQRLFETMLKENKTYEWVYGNLGLIQFEQGHYSEAIEYFKQALRRDPERGDTHYYMGLAFFHWHYYPSAEAAFLRAIHYDPEILDAKRKLGQVYVQQNRIEEAKNIFAEILELKPDDVEVREAVRRLN